MMRSSTTTPAPERDRCSWTSGPGSGTEIARITAVISPPDARPRAPSCSWPSGPIIEARPPAKWTVRRGAEQAFPRPAMASPATLGKRHIFSGQPWPRRGRPLPRKRDVPGATAAWLAGMRVGTVVVEGGGGGRWRQAGVVVVGARACTNRPRASLRPGDVRAEKPGNSPHAALQRSSCASTGRQREARRVATEATSRC